MSVPTITVPDSRPNVKTGVRLPPPVVLVLLALLTRLPLQSRMLYHWDSVNFALAVQKFDMTIGQPHAPGYLLYVMLGRAAAALTGSAERGYVLLAIIGTALAACALYDLGRRLWNPRVGWFAALLLLSSPMYWFYGEVALPHALDALMVIVAATLSWRVWRGEARLGDHARPVARTGGRPARTDPGVPAAGGPRRLLEAALADHSPVPRHPHRHDPGVADSPAAPERRLDALLVRGERLLRGPSTAARPSSSARAGSGCTTT